MTVSTSHSDHLLHHLLPQFLPQIGHHETQLVDADETIAVLVEHLEGFSDLFLAVGVLLKSSGLRSRAALWLC